jgi:hypothetical protein
MLVAARVGNGARITCVFFCLGFASFESFHLRLISGVIFFPRNESGPPRHILVKLFLVKPRMEVIEKRSLSVSAAVKERSQGEIGQKSCGDEGNGDGEKLRVGQV